MLHFGNYACALTASKAMNGPPTTTAVKRHNTIVE